MYTSYIGKKFLKLYNERMGTSLSAKEFFDNVQFPIFFDDERHLMHVHGSTFFQKVGKDFDPSIQSEPEYRRARLHRDLANNVFSGSTYVGYAAGGIRQPTSSQTTSLKLTIDREDAYTSWIGQALSLGIKGGLLLIEEPVIWWLLFEGWPAYREYLNQTPSLKPRQIETWNSHWLNALASLKNPTKSKAFHRVSQHITSSEGTSSIATLEWAEGLFAVARISLSPALNAYAYLLEKQNKTYGFIRIYLGEFNHLFELRDKLFLDKTESVLTDDEIRRLEPLFRFPDACGLGLIGLRALEPKHLRDYMPKGSRNWAKGNDFKFKDEQSRINFQLYKLWIMSILNKKELLDLADKTAESLIAFETPANRGKTTGTNLSQEVRNSKNMKDFIGKLTELLAKSPQNAQVFKQVVDEVIQLPMDSFPLFVTLVRFQYTFRKSYQSQSKTLEQ